MAYNIFNETLSAHNVYSIASADITTAFDETPVKTDIQTWYDAQTSRVAGDEITYTTPPVKR